MCGLFGASGSRINQDKLNILGIYNDARGGDSCGVWDGKRTVNWERKISDGKGKFINFAKTYHIDTKSLTVLGHTRKASPGIFVDEENAHPFVFSRIIGTHNGVIRNTKELADMYDTELHKSDSKSLYEIINKLFEEEENPEEAVALLLGKYLGAAALAFTDIKNPGSLYLFRGESVKTPLSKEGIYEERPLYVQTVGKTLYYSSMDDALLTACKGATDIDGNTLYKYMHGEYIEEFEVDRRNCYSETVFKENSKTTYGSTGHVIPNKDDSEDMLSEVLPKDFFKKGGRGSGRRIYFHRGRYWLNGHLVGSNAFLPLYIAEDGEVIDMPEYIDEKEETFTATNKDGQWIVGNIRYFFNGNMFMNRLAYKEFIKIYSNDGKSIAMITSVMGKFFLTPFKVSEAKRLLNYGYTVLTGDSWEFWGGQSTGRVSFPYSDKVYYFIGGKLKSPKKETPVIQLSIDSNIEGPTEEEVEEMENFTTEGDSIDEPEVSEFESQIYLRSEALQDYLEKVERAELNKNDRALYDIADTYINQIICYGVD